MDELICINHCGFLLGSASARLYLNGLWAIEFFALIFWSNAMHTQALLVRKILPPIIKPEPIQCEWSPMYWLHMLKILCSWSDYLPLQSVIKCSICSNYIHLSCFAVWNYELFTNYSKCPKMMFVPIVLACCRMIQIG